MNILNDPFDGEEGDIAGSKKKCQQVCVLYVLLMAQGPVSCLEFWS